MREDTPSPAESLAEKVRRANTAVRRAGPRPEGARSAGSRRPEPRLSAWRMHLSIRIAARHLYLLCLQLRAYIEAGFPIVEAWRLMSLSTNHPLMRRLCLRVHRDLQSGKTLVEALRRHEGRLPRFFVEMMAAAERAGAHSGVLDTLQRHYAWLFQIKGEIIRGVSYLLFNLILGKFVFMVRDYMLLGIHQSQARGLQYGLPHDPALTALRFILTYLGPVLIAALAAYLLTSAMQQSRRVRAPIDLIGLTMPGIGGIIRRYCVANFCRMFATLTSAGMHPSSVYRGAAASMGNVALERRILKWARFVDDGEPATEALRRAGVLSFETLAMIEVSETTASTGDVLPRLADHTAEALRHQLRGLMRALTPLAPFLIAFLFFGGFAWSLLFFLPLYDFIIFVIFFLIFLL